MDVARRSIEHGLASGRPLVVTPSEYHRDLKAVRASFVTLQKNGQLRGCIGHLEAVQPVVVDVAENAFAAAFRDPRFSPLTAAEWPDVDVHLSLLTTPERMQFSDEADLIGQIRPGEDGPDPAGRPEPGDLSALGLGEPARPGRFSGSPEVQGRAGGQSLVGPG